MKSMKDKVLLDSNIILYGFGREKTKKEIVKNLIRERPLLTTQVINEVLNVLIKKFNFSIDEVKEVLNFLRTKTEIILVNLYTIDIALTVKERYNFSYWDSLIIASALENGCRILYTEDMQHGQVIEKTLTIKNPFFN
ncbi:MAG: hypothetical protein DRQ24_11790 [Candidatus Latescibacterota bacterium]|nr:MAG: hypothetical protein DRQ24_11790 [Candidatus Latescibacterota bacterium]